jgi:hypothetical protein
VNSIRFEKDHRRDKGQGMVREGEREGGKKGRTDGEKHRAPFEA